MQVQVCVKMCFFIGKFNQPLFPSKCYHMTHENPKYTFLTCEFIRCTFWSIELQRLASCTFILFRLVLEAPYIWTESVYVSSTRQTHVWPTQNSSGHHGVCASCHFCILMLTRETLCQFTRQTLNPLSWTSQQIILDVLMFLFLPLLSFPWLQTALLLYHLFFYI